MISHNEFIEKMERLMIILGHKFTEGDKFSVLYPKEQEEFQPLIDEIRIFLFEFPGEIIFAPDAKPEFYKLLIKYLWSLDEYDDFLYEYLLRETDVGQIMISEYISRIKEIRPVFISLPQKYIRFQTYLSEAISCYVNGLNNASMIVCVSVIEDALRVQLEKIDSKYVSKINDVLNPTAVHPRNLMEMINYSQDLRLIDKVTASKFHAIRKTRNDAVHDLKEIDKTEVLQCIYDTIHLIEALFGKKDN